MSAALRLPQRPLLSPGFEFRSWSAEDIPSLVAAWRDPEMHRWMPEEEEPFDDRRAREFVAGAATQLTEGTMLAMAIADLSTGAVAGSVTFTIWAAHHWNIGYWIATAYRGHGLATRAVTTASRWAFEDQPGLSRISLYTLPDNVASQQVAERAGFQREGTLRKWANVRGRDVDWIMFSLLRADIANGVRLEGPRHPGRPSPGHAREQGRRPRTHSSTESSTEASATSGSREAGSSSSVPAWTTKPSPMRWASSVRPKAATDS